MKLLLRNTTPFEYYAPHSHESDLNEQGEHTGDFQPVYSEPVRYRGNISAPSGSTQHQFYGEEIRYTHTLVMDNPNVNIEEQGVIEWQGNLYDVVAVRPSLNVMSIALRRRIDGSEGEDTDEFCD